MIFRPRTSLNTMAEHDEFCWTSQMKNAPVMTKPKEEAGRPQSETTRSRPVAWTDSARWW